MSNKIVGASFSHPHLLNLKLSLEDALKQYVSLDLKYIRLGCYWSEIEKIPTQYDFSFVDKLVDISEKLGIKVVMTVGMKAPRYPEYYIPQWVLDKMRIDDLSFTNNDDFLCKSLFSYLKETISHLKNKEIIHYWQVENEPLDPSGPNWWKIEYQLLSKEVELVKSIDPSRQIIVNLWGNELKRRNYYIQAVKIADIIGFDLYSQVPSNTQQGLKFNGPHDSESEIQKIIQGIKNKGREIWISELQAEPWTHPESCLPQHIVDNTEWIMKYDIDAVFYWGFEYWYQQKIKGNPAFWQSAQKAIELLR